MKGLVAGVVLLLVAVSVLVSVRMSIRAQERTRVVELPPLQQSQSHPTDRGTPGVERGPTDPSVQDALQRPFSFPFAAPVSLSDLCKHLRRKLKAPVVLDVSALDRQDLRPDDTVQLELEGVRLRTGLKLLLDQVGLTYQVVPEDNLLILTDTHGTTDPIDRLASEVKSLHRDIHDIQDAIDDIRWSLGLDEDESGAMMRKPTIIEEIPGEEKPEEEPEMPPADAVDRKRSRPGI